ncbi:FadR/GntR family transcriptional regulator [Marispirochaeta aestuarii]|nr:FadR/GntR family transcriptional regulator [Marispirochaeta aestuarii]
MTPLFQEIKTNTRARQIVEKFRQAIGEGSLKIGDKLPPERELCTQLGVSRTSLREAVRILEAYGILESIQGGGTFVTDRFAENVFDFLGFGGALDRNTLVHLLQTRRILEAGAIAQAVSVAEDKELEELEAIVDSLEKETETAKLGLLDARFHETIIELSRNPILTSVYRLIYKMMTRAVSTVIAYPTARGIAVADHRNILSAMKKRDKVQCLDLVDAHAEHTLKLIDDHFKEGG